MWYGWTWEDGVDRIYIANSAEDAEYAQFIHAALAALPGVEVLSTPREPLPPHELIALVTQRIRSSRVVVVCASPSYVTQGIREDHLSSSIGVPIVAVAMRPLNSAHADPIGDFVADVAFADVYADPSTRSEWLSRLVERVATELPGAGDRRGGVDRRQDDVSPLRGVSEGYPPQPIGARSPNEGPRAPGRERAPRRFRCDATAFCPGGLLAGETTLIQIVVHERSRRRAARIAARLGDSRVPRTGPKTSVGELERGDVVNVAIDAKGGTVEAPSQKTASWVGEELVFGFGIRCDGGTRHATIHATVSVNGALVGHIAFSRPVRLRFSLSDWWNGLTEPRLSRYRRAFFSYAREDRERVQHVARQYDRFGVWYFQDLLHLDPGERWEKRLYKEIDRCDVFVLFWSDAARASKWVIKECERACLRNERSGGLLPTLRPEVLQHPSPRPEQGWLAAFHLDDPRFYYAASGDTPTSLAARRTSGRRQPGLVAWAGWVILTMLGVAVALASFARC